MRQTGRTTRMLLELALYISEHWNEDKKVLLVSHSVRYATDLLMQLRTFFPGAKRFAYTSVTFGKVVVRPFSFSDLKKPEVTHGTHWDVIFRDHYIGGEYHG